MKNKIDKHITQYRIIGQLKNGEESIYGMNSSNPDVVKEFIQAEFKKESNRKYTGIYAESVNDDSPTIHITSKRRK